MSLQPTRNRVRISGDATIIELAIPVHGFGGSGGEDATCHICRHSFCHREECCRAPTHLACCTQGICTSCVARLAKRCRCSDTCGAVVAMCPYCREMSPIPALDLYRGSVLKECRSCAAASAAPVPSPVPAPAPTPASAVVAASASSVSDGGHVDDMDLDDAELYGPLQPRRPPAAAAAAAAPSSLALDASLLEYLFP